METIVPELNLATEGANSAVLLPVPAYPRVRTLRGADHLFSELDLATESSSGGPILATGGAWTATSRAFTGRQVVGGYDVSVLAGSGPSAVSGWIHRHGYALRLADQTILRAYALRHWRFVAIRLRGHQSGALRPLAISFASKQIVYPMRLSAVASAPVNLELFVSADGVASASGTPLHRVRVATLRQVAHLVPPAVRDVLPGIYLTRLKMSGVSPRRIHGDITLGLLGRRASAKLATHLGGSPRLRRSVSFAPTASTTGSISGKVTAAATGATIGNVEVDVYDASDNIWASSCTAADGSYSIGGLPAANYEVGFSPAGMFGGCPGAPQNYAQQFYNGKSTLSTATPVAVSAGASASGIDAALSAGGQITGTVTDAKSSASVAGICVTVYDQSGSFAGSTSTDASGHYTVSGLGTGSYTVGFDGCGATNYLPQFYNGKASQASADTVSVTQGSTTAGIDAALQPGGQITGKITDASNQAAIAGICVTAYDSSGNTLASAMSDAAGNYTLSGLSTGSYAVGFDGCGTNYLPTFYNGKSPPATPDAVSVTTGSTTSGIDAALQPAGQITGKVTADATGAGIANVGVNVYDANDNFVTSTCTGADGTYDAVGLLTGSYKVAFSPYAQYSGCAATPQNYAQRFYDGQLSLSSANPVAVSAGSTTSGIDAALPAGGEITGTVTDASTGIAVAGTCVSAFDADGNQIAFATTDGSGDYTIPGLSTGSYKIGFNGCRANYLSQFYNGASSLASADLVSVTEGSTTSGINAALQSGAQITGSVVDAATHAPIAGVVVEAFPSQSGPSGPFPLVRARTDPSGNYTLTGLEPGRYTVEFIDPPGGYVAQFYNGKSSPATADAVSVTQGSTTSGIDAALQSAAQITGKVTDAGTGAPLANVGVAVYDSNGTIVTSVCTASDGTYTVANLAAGTYRIGFAESQPFGFCSGNPSNYLPQFYSGSPSLSGATPVTVSAGATSTGINASLQPGDQLEGKVKDAVSGNAIANVEVDVYDASSRIVGSACTAPDGSYAVGGLASGRYRVGFATASPSGRCGPRVNYAPQFYNGAASLAGAATVVVTDGVTTSGIDAALQPGGQITGTVTDAPTSATLAAICVTAYDTNLSMVASGATDGNGHYTLLGLAAGSYDVVFNYCGSSSNPVYQPQVYNGKSSPSNADKVTLAAGGTASGIDAALQPGGHISGTVTDSTTSAPLAGICVAAYDSAGASFLSATTDSNGHYTISGLAAGPYRIGFSGCGANYVSQFYSGKASLPSADPVTVTVPDTTSGVDAALHPGGQISGTVTDSTTSAPLAGVCVTVYDSSGNGVAVAASGANGQYTVPALATGSYRVSFSGGCGGSAGYPSQFYNDKPNLATADTVAVTEGSNTSGINAALVAGAPGNVSPPTISGTAQQGQTLTEAHGAWTNNPSSTGYAYQWLRCDSLGGSCTPIAGANNQTYTPTADDGGYTLEVQETASNAGGTSAPATSMQTAVVPPSPPASTSPPTIAGSARQGQTLTEAHGAWTNNPSEFGYAYQWLRCDSAGANCSAIPGATDPTYVLTSGDAGHTIEVQETASNAGGTGNPATSAPTAVVLPLPPANSAPPTISGKAQDGQPLTEAHGQWTNNPTSHAYQWLRCDSAGSGCVAISGASNQTYVPTSDDVGQTIEVQETASNAGGLSDPASSAATEVVLPAPPVNTAVPSISGTPQQGQTLAEAHGSWTNNPSSYAYQWLRCDTAGANCIAISGATDQSYAAALDDVGHTLEVQETASNAGGTSNPATSGPTGVVRPLPPVNVAPPAMSGKAQQGQTLTESHGQWTNNPDTYDYQWFQCDSSGHSCTAISGATNQTYVPASDDVGHTIEVQETASNTGGPSSPATSPASAVVVPPIPVNTAPPTVSGTAQQGQTLTDVHGSWTNSPSSYAYQWLRCDTAGANCVPIADATGQSYVATSDDVGHEVEVQETASNAGGTSSPTSSAPTAVVAAAPPVSTAPPTISGKVQQGQSLTEAHGQWTNSPDAYTYQWLQCDSAGLICAAIAGAVDQSYVPSADDVGHTLEVQETASNAAGPGNPATSARSAVVLPAPPVNASPPTISGTAQQGQTLAEGHGAWTNNPSVFGYGLQWLRCDGAGANCAVIPGATDQSYVPSGDDVGHTLEVEETASNAGGTSDPATSAATAAVLAAPPVNTVPPTVSGTAQQGQTLTEAHGSWTNQPTSYAYQWLRCDDSASHCTAISGATAQTYVPSADDVGHTIEVQETARNAFLTSSPAGSLTTAVVLPAAPANTAPPAISGTAQQGGTLTEQNGSWSNRPTGFAHQWLRCDGAGTTCAAIAGATDQSYVPTADDVGHTLEVQEKASNAGGTSDPATSSATAAVLAAPPVNTALPTVSGTAQEGQTLTEAHGSWTNQPTSFDYQWLQCDSSQANCAAIHGATSQTYVPAAADAGHTLEVRETARNAFLTGSPAVSAPTAVVLVAAPSNTSRPTVTGSVGVGQTLTEVHGAWTGSPTSYAYQWMQCDAGGANCVAIPHAQGPAYTPADSDVGHTVAVEETASNGGGAGAPAASTATAAVPAPPLVARAGENIQAIANVPVTLDGTGSTPADRISSYHWTFGDGQSADAASVSHAYSLPGTYTATLAVSDGSSSNSQSVTVTVSSPPPHTVLATVQTSGGQPISGADVAYIAPDGTRTSAVSDNSGVASLGGLPDGSDVVYVYAPGFAPAATGVSVQDGSGRTVIQLQPGQAATTSLSSEQLTEQQIIDAGINPNDPANRVVVKFEVHLAFVPDSGSPSSVAVSGYVNSAGSFVGDTSGSGGGGGPVTCASGGCSTPAGTVVPYVVDGHPMLEWLIFGGQASFLKQFFRLTLLVQNLSPDPFNLSAGNATLRLPDGLSLAPTAKPQSLTQSVNAIPGDGSASTTWFVRGDAPGSYQPSAEYTSTLQPVGAPIDIASTLQDPMQVFGAGSLKLSIDADQHATDRYPYHLRIGLTNTAPGPIYNAEVQLDPNKHVNFLYQPQERLTREIDTIAPGQTVWTDDFILAPQITGSLDPGDSFVVDAAGERNSTATITGHPTVEPPESAPAITAIPVDGQVELSWAPVPGATAYRVFSTPDRNTPFGSPSGVHLLAGGAPQSDTVAEVDPGQLDPNTNTIHVHVDAPIGQERWYAVSSILNGVPTLEHPLIPATIPVTPPIVTTRPATDVVPASATLNGSLDAAGGKLTNCHFELGTSNSYGTKIPCSQDGAAGAGTTVVSAPASGLTQGKTYHFRLVADNGKTEVDGDDLTFTTPVPGKPAVMTGDPDSLTNSGATLHGTVTPTGFNVTDCHFDYGIGSFTNTAPCAEQAGSGFAAVPVSAQLKGLTDGQTYQYRVSATNSAGNTTGDTKSVSICDAHEVKIGVIDALGCFAHKGGGDYLTSGKVRLNGIDFVPNSGGTITLQTGHPIPTLHAEGGGKAEVGDWVLQDWNNAFDFPMIGKTEFDLPSDSQFKGAPVVGTTASVTFSPDEGATLTAELSFAKILGDSLAEGSADFKTNNTDGLSIDQLDFKLGDPGLSVIGDPIPSVSEFKLFGEFEIDELRAHWSRDGNIWSIGGDVDLGKLLKVNATDFPGYSTIKVGADIGVTPKNPFVFPWLDLAFVKADVNDLNKPIADGVFLQRLSAEVHFKPRFEIGGGIGFSVGPALSILGDREAISLDGNLLLDTGNADTGDPLDLKATGTVQVVGTPVEDGFIEYKHGGAGPDSVTMGGNEHFKLGPVSLDGHVYGAVYPQRFQLGGQYDANLFGIGLSAGGIVSNAGIGACGHVSLGPFSSPDIGFKDHWGHWPEPSGCDFGDLVTINEAQASAADGRAAANTVSFRVPAGLSRAEFAAVGGSGSPSVTLIGPDGQQIVTSAEGALPAATPSMLAIREAQTKTTYFFVNHPAPGLWRVVPHDSASRPVRIERAYPMPKPHVTAHISGRGRVRTLSWQMNSVPGQSVTFVENGRATGRVLGTVHGHRGSLRFVPNSGAGGVLRIVALIDEDGFPRAQQTVASYFSPAPARPAKPRRVTVRRNGSRVSVSWAGAPSTSSYQVTVEVGRGGPGLRVNIAGHRRTVTFAGASPSATLFISVQGFGPNGRSGPAAQITVPPKRRR